jgi:hypothetical protein
VKPEGVRAFRARRRRIHAQLIRVNVAALGLLVLVRTFLGWAIIVEIEGRWPWQPARVRGE